jgi:hypothetical protein
VMMKWSQIILAVLLGTTVAADSLYLTRGQSCSLFVYFFYYYCKGGSVAMDWSSSYPTAVFADCPLILQHHRTRFPDPGESSQTDTRQNRVCLHPSTAPPPLPRIRWTVPEPDQNRHNGDPNRFELLPPW